MGAPGRGSTMVRERTCLERTGKVTPEPCDAVEINPPRVWSEIEPMLGRARGGSAAAKVEWMS
jgi:hypothetical protein